MANGLQRFTILWTIGCIGLFLLVSKPVYPQSTPSISPEQWTFFLEESNGKYANHGTDKKQDIEDILYEIADNSNGLEPTVVKFAQTQEITKAQAEAYIHLIILSVFQRENCSVYSRNIKNICTKLDVNKDLVRAIRHTGLSENSGDLLLAVGKNVSNREDISVFIDLVASHSEFRKIMLALAEYSNKFDYIAPLLVLPDPPIEQFQAAGADFYDDYQSEDILTLLFFTLRRLQNEQAEEKKVLSVRLSLISQLLERGLNGAALLEYDQLTESQKQFFTWIKLKNLPVSLVAALWLDERKPEARNLIQQLNNHRDELNEKELRTLAFLQNVIKNNVPPKKLFEIFMFGRPYGTKPPEGKEQDSTFQFQTFITTSGWAFLLKNQSPALRHLSANFALEHKMPNLAQYLVSRERFYQYREERLSRFPEKLSKNLGSNFSKIRQDMRLEISIAEKNWLSVQQSFALVTTPASKSSLKQQRPVPYRELILAKEYQTLGEGEKKPTQGEEIPGLEALGIFPYQIVRSELRSDQQTVIYLSHTLDPVGEMSGGGYWVIRSRDKGISWQDSVYLGLQQYFPYEVVPKSKLPLLDGDFLQIEVEIKELDRRSISFPPIRLSLKRHQKHLYLRFSWAALLADSDADGLSDVVEFRLGIDMLNKDTDGDGLDDGYDALPNLAFVDSPEKFELGLMLVNALFGYEDGALITGLSPNIDQKTSISDLLEQSLNVTPVRINPASTLFLLGDPTLFQSLILPTRLIVLAPDSKKNENTEYGIFYPTRILWMFSDPAAERYYLIWSASWVGGSFLIQKKNGHFEIEVIKRWVT